MKIRPITNDFGAVVSFFSNSDLLKGNHLEFMKQLSINGILIFRTDEKICYQTFCKFTESLTPKFMSHPAKVRKALNEDKTVQSVTEGPEEIVLHSELHYSPFLPDFLWFYCEDAPPFGGETNLADGRKFFSELTEETQNILKSKNLLYWTLWEREIWESYFPKLEKDKIVEAFQARNAKAWFNGKGDLEFEVIKPAVLKKVDGKFCFINQIAAYHQYISNIDLFHDKSQGKELRHRLSFEGGESIPRSVIEDINRAEKVTKYSHSWNNGDLILIDNSQVLHGRNSYDPAVKRSIMVRMASI